MNYVKIVLMLVLLSVFSGCATKATMENMKYNKPSNQYDLEFKNSIDIFAVNGGKETPPYSRTNVGNSEFEEALIESLKKEGLYSENGRYQLKVEIIGFEEPKFAFDITIKMNTKYTLLDFENKSIVFAKVLSTPYTATFSDAFSGLLRYKLAKEGSARENITSLLNEIAALKINSMQVSSK